MGSFFTNVQVHTSGQPPDQIREVVADAMRTWILSGPWIEASADEADFDRAVLISAPGSEPWLSVYDEATENQDTALLFEQARRLSTATGTAAVAVLVHDS